ncbi:hypothetical protein GJ496_005938 [Pomphorhynchus laevis]|nr:hypothetical protein GJ496_005938 [Pomphorhynchus laevis]
MSSIDEAVNEVLTLILDELDSKYDSQWYDEKAKFMLQHVIVIDIAYLCGRKLLNMYRNIVKTEICEEDLQSSYMELHQDPGALHSGTMARKLSTF